VLPDGSGAMGCERRRPKDCRPAGLERRARKRRQPVARKLAHPQRGFAAQARCKWRRRRRRVVAPVERRRAVGRRQSIGSYCLAPINAAARWAWRRCQRAAQPARRPANFRRHSAAPIRAEWRREASNNCQARGGSSARLGSARLASASLA